MRVDWASGVAPYEYYRWGNSVFRVAIGGDTKNTTEVMVPCNKNSVNVQSTAQLSQASTRAHGRGDVDYDDNVYNVYNFDDVDNVDNVSIVYNFDDVDNVDNVANVGNIDDVDNSEKKLGS